jgi:transposase
LPPPLEELIAADPPVRYVAAFVDGLDRAAWNELGVAPDGAARGALASHPRVLLGVWLSGFMTGVGSSRTLEGACRDQLPSRWLTGWQRPDHHTLWRFDQGHRQAMRRVLKRTVRTAVEAGLVDLAVQAVDGTRIAGSAARARTLGPDGLAGLLACVQIAIDDLEAQNAGGDDPPPGRLPRDLTQLAALRDRVQTALARVSATDGPARANVTDSDATRQQARGGGFVVGYNAQALVAGLVRQDPDDPDGPGGLLITAADVTTDRDDHEPLVPLLEPATELTGAAPGTLLADGGDHAAANLLACAAHDPPVPVLRPDPQAPAAPDAYHQDRVVYDPATATSTGPHGQPLTFQGLVSQGPGKPRARKYRASKPGCAACPVRAQGTTATTIGRSITIGAGEDQLRAHRACLATDQARAAYRRRTTRPEPTFGILKEQQAARRFLLRGLANVRAEWSLLATACTLRTRARRWRAAGCPTPATFRRSHLPAA